MSLKMMEERMEACQDDLAGSLHNTIFFSIFKCNNNPLDLFHVQAIALICEENARFCPLNVLNLSSSEGIIKFIYTNDAVRMTHNLEC